MAEMLFGAVPQLWPTLPGLGFYHAFAGNRINAGGPPSAIPMPAGPFTSGLTMAGSTLSGEVGQPVASGWPTPASAPVVSAPPVLGPWSEFAAGITPQALLTVVAMRRGQPTGPTTDQEIEDFICDALDLLSGANDVEVRCEHGRATLTGSVPNKRVKRDVGEIVWWIPSVNDVQNSLTIAPRRRSRGTVRETETPAAVTGPGRRQA